MKTDANIQQLLADFLAEGKRYVGLQTELAKLIVAEKAATVLSTMLVGLVIVLFLAMALFFPLMALAAWIGALTHSVALGYLCVAVLVVLVFAVVYALRRRLIVEPITRAMAAIFAPEADDKPSTPHE